MSLADRLRAILNNGPDTPSDDYLRLAAEVQSAVAVEGDGAEETENVAEDTDKPHLVNSMASQIDLICDEFEKQWQSGKLPKIEDHIEPSRGEIQPALLLELVRLELEYRRSNGEQPRSSEYEARFPDHGSLISEAFSTMNTTSLGIRRPRRFSVPKRLGDYELMEELGRGGMGMVYKARQVSLGRITAVKMILAGDLAVSDEIERFRVEAETAASLDHAGIVPIYEVGEENGQHYFSMGYVDGPSLADQLKDGPFEPRRAAEMTQQIAQAVEYAHQRSVIHRDLKPANVLIDQNGAPRVTDFGLAKRITMDAGLTTTGQILGTPSYMSPEQAASQLVGSATDIYSLGALLYALLTGRPPHQAATQMETVLNVLNEEPAPPRDINRQLPRDLETICLRCLHKSAKRRYTTAGELADDLNRWLNGEPIRARRVGPIERSYLWCKRRPGVASLMGLLVLVIVIGSAVFVERQNALKSSDLLDSLATADIEGVPALVDQIEQYRWWTYPDLRVRLGETSDDASKQMRFRIALSRFDADQAGPLYEVLLTSDVRNIGTLRQALSPHKGAVLNRLWTVFRDEKERQKRFKAGLALASFAAEDPKWTSHDFGFLANELTSAFSESQPMLRAYLKPVGHHLLAELERLFRDPDANQLQQVAAASALAEFAGDDPIRIAMLAADATSDQFGILFPLLKKAADLVRNQLEPIVAKNPDKDLLQGKRIQLGRRRAGAAITMVRQGSRRQVLNALRVNADPESLTQFVHGCRPREVTVSQLLECLDEAGHQRREASAEQPSHRQVIYALLLALGEYDLEDVPAEARDTLIQKLANWYAEDPSSTVHSATGWLLRRWGQNKLNEAVDTTPRPYDPSREWFVDKIVAGSTTFYQTYVVIRPGTYSIGAPKDENGRKSVDFPRQVKLNHSFAILDREITRGEWEAMHGMPYPIGKWSPTAKHPLVAANWYHSVYFCRWLSSRSGFTEGQQSYADPATLSRVDFPRDQSRFAQGMPRNMPVDIKRPGYRLPTEAEWEIACRAGTSSAFSFGNDKTLLSKYGWFATNSDVGTHLPRQKRPNLFGLFDMHGNALEWCHNWYGTDRKDLMTDDDLVGPTTGQMRILRGGGWNYVDIACRSASRGTNTPILSGSYTGFRVCRTLPK